MTLLREGFLKPWSLARGDAHCPPFPRAWRCHCAYAAAAPSCSERLFAAGRTGLRDSNDHRWEIARGSRAACALRTWDGHFASKFQGAANELHDAHATGIIRGPASKRGRRDGTGACGGANYRSSPLESPGKYFSIHALVEIAEFASHFRSVTTGSPVCVRTLYDCDSGTPKLKRHLEEGPASRRAPSSFLSCACVHARPRGVRGPGEPRTQEPAC